MGQYLADVVAAGAGNDQDCIACRALEHTSCQSTVCFHMPDLHLDGVTSSQEFRQQGRGAFAHAADQHAGARHAMAAITSVDHGQAGLYAIPKAPKEGRRGLWLGENRRRHGPDHVSRCRARQITVHPDNSRQ